jgi:hypothetical protein
MDSKSLISVNLKLLNKQIKDLLNSNIEENSKSGLHNLLGNIADEIVLFGSAMIVKSNQTKGEK